MNSGATAERVYDALKTRLLSGDIRPGERLDPAVLADTLASSVTPVRDALHRLVGERLIETRPGEGFRLPPVNEPSLRDLYAWSDQLLRVMIAAWPASETAPRANALPVDLERATPAFFALFAVRSGNLEHAAQIAATSDRLAAARAAERRVLAALEEELRELAVAFDRGTRRDLGRRVAAYHRRRLRAVPEIVRALFRA